MLLLTGTGIVAAVPATTPPVGAARLEKYDDYFRKYTKRFFGIGFDWRFFKAQAIVESNLRPEIVSAAGARGMMQLLPSTYADIRRRHADFGDINAPEWNIAAGIAYSREQWDYWVKEADQAFQKHFTLGSYNAGRATMMRAQKVAQAQKLNYRVWTSIEAVAPMVPNWRHSETLSYVTAVFTNLEAMDRQGRTEGPTVSRQDSGGKSLADQLKKLKSLKSVFNRLRSSFN